MKSTIHTLHRASRCPWPPTQRTHLHGSPADRYSFWFDGRHTRHLTPGSSLYLRHRGLLWELLGTDNSGSFLEAYTEIGDVADELIGEDDRVGEDDVSVGPVCLEYITVKHFNWREFYPRCFTLLLSFSGDVLTEVC